MRRIFLLIVAGALAVGAPCIGAEKRVGKPIPRAKTAATQAKFNQARLKFLLADVECYTQQTKDPPAVREKAADFIRDVYVKYSLGQAQPTWAELNQTAKELLADGSQDPIVLMQSGEVLMDMQQNEKAAQRLTEAAIAYKKSDYPARLHCRALCWLVHTLDLSLRLEEMGPFVADYCEATGRSLQEDTKSENQRFLVYYAPHNPTYFPTTVRQAFMKNLEVLNKTCSGKPEINPWSREMMAGRYYITLAWHHRGSGYANTVTEEGAAKFDEYLHEAAKHYTAAWELHRDWPEAAAEMIYVSMGSGGNGPTSREWFDRAVAAQMDYAEAYFNLLWNLRPRWHGSHKEMYQFGLECLATRRFDTDVPYQLIKALLDIQSELKGTKTVWQQPDICPDVYKKVKIACEGMEKEPSRADHSHTMSFQAVGAICTQQYADARRLLEKLGDRAEASMFQKFHRNLAADRPMVFALTGKEKAKVFQALKLWEKSDDSVARLKACDLLQAASKLDDDPRAKAFYQSRLGQAECEKAFAAGGWVDLTFGPEKGLWDANEGFWDVISPNQVVGKNTENPVVEEKKPSPKGKRKAKRQAKQAKQQAKKSRVVSDKGLIYTCRARFSPPLEIEVDVDLSNSQGVGVNLGQWQYDRFKSEEENSHGLLFWIDNSRRQAGLFQSAYGPWSYFNQPIARPCRIHLRIWQDYFEFFYDGRMFPVHHWSTWSPEDLLSLSNYRWAYEDGEVRFSNVRVRKLTQAVPPPESDDQMRIQYYSDVLSKDSKDAYAYAFRALANYRLGKHAESKNDLQKAIALRSDVANVLLSRAEYLSKTQEDFAVARDIFAIVTQVRPNNMEALRARAWFLATCEDSEYRNGSAALANAQRALELTKRDKNKCLMTIAAAQAELGQYEEAIKTAQQVMQSEFTAANTKAKTRKMLKQFRARQPYREPKIQLPID